jgi:hypothetical protein
MGYLGQREIGSGSLEDYTAPVPAKSEYEWYGSFLFLSQDRIQRYADFEDMDDHAFTGAIFDIYAEEATVKNSEGHGFSIQCDDEKVKSALTELYYERINVDFRGYEVARGMAKFGDEFRFLVLDKERKGVLYLKDMPAYSVYRLEAENKLIAFVQYGPNGQAVTLDPFSVVHWRLGMTKDKYKPYGVALLDPARRHFRQLKLMEDSMVVYRIARAPERRIFYINVGRMPPAKAEGHIQQIISKFRKQPTIRQDGRKLEWRSHNMCIDLKTEIPLMDGRTVPLTTLIQEHEAGKQNWTYSIDRSDMTVHPGQIEWAGVTRKNAEVVKVTLDNGESITCTPDHKFISRTGEYVEAKDLLPGDSMAALYRKTSERPKNPMAGYEMVWSPNTVVDGRTNFKDSDGYVYTHQIVGESKFGTLLDPKVYSLHHTDHNKFNNNPENLEQFPVVEHSTRHAKEGNYGDRFTRMNQTLEHRELVAETNRIYGKAQKMGDAYNHSELHKEHDAIRSEALKNTWVEKGDQIKEKCILKFDEKVWDFLAKLVNKNPKINREAVIEALNTDMRAHLLKINPGYRWAHREKILSRMILETRLDEKGYSGLTEFKQKNIVNHKIKSVEYIKETMDTGCLNIAQYHNFATSTCFIKNSVDEDFYIPVRDGNDGTRVEQLPGAASLGEIDDVKFFKDYICTFAKIPRVYLQDPDGGSAERRENLQVQDVRFSHAIARFQAFYLEGMVKIGIIHLLLQGFTKKQAISFTLKGSHSSFEAEKLQMEIETQKIELAQKFIEAGFPRAWAQQRVLNMTPTEIDKLQEWRRAEDLLMAQREAEIEAYRAASATGLEQKFVDFFQTNGEINPSLELLKKVAKQKIEPPIDKITQTLVNPDGTPQDAAAGTAPPQGGKPGGYGGAPAAPQPPKIGGTEVDPETGFTADPNKPANPLLPNRDQVNPGKPRGFEPVQEPYGPQGFKPKPIFGQKTITTLPNGTTVIKERQGSGVTRKEIYEVVSPEVRKFIEGNEDNKGERPIGLYRPTFDFYSTGECSPLTLEGLSFIKRNDEETNESRIYEAVENNRLAQFREMQNKFVKEWLDKQPFKAQENSEERDFDYEPTDN